MVEAVELSADYCRVGPSPREGLCEKVVVIATRHCSFVLRWLMQLIFWVSSISSSVRKLAYIQRLVGGGPEARRPRVPACCQNVGIVCAVRGKGAAPSGRGSDRDDAVLRRFGLSCCCGSLRVRTAAGNSAIDLTRKIIRAPTAQWPLAVTINRTSTLQLQY